MLISSFVFGILFLSFLESIFRRCHSLSKTTAFPAMTAPKASIDPTKNPTKLTTAISCARNSNPSKNVSHHLKPTAKDTSRMIPSIAGSVSLCKRS